jgi:hypothetical protein
MGILLVIGMMVYAAGLCCLFQRIDQRTSRVPEPEMQPDESLVDAVVPDRVPRAWVDAFRSEQGG